MLPLPTQLLLTGIFAKMKTAQELRHGNVIMVNDEPQVVARSEISKAGGSAATIIKLKLRNLLSGSGSEKVCKADEKFEVVVLERKVVTYSYFASPHYVFMDNDYQQHEIEADNIGSAIKYLEVGMPCEVIFYSDRAISLELPNTIVREVEYTEPVVRGDTSGKVMKTARLATGFELPVPSFITTGDKIEIDTRTDEYKNRVK